MPESLHIHLPLLHVPYMVLFGFLIPALGLLLLQPNQQSQVWRWRRRESWRPRDWHVLDRNAWYDSCIWWYRGWRDENPIIIWLGWTDWREGTSLVEGSAGTNTDVSSVVDAATPRQESRDSEETGDGTALEGLGRGQHQEMKAVMLVGHTIGAHNCHRDSYDARVCGHVFFQV